MPHKHEAAYSPVDPIAPSNAIIIQSRIDPSKCGIQKLTDADWRVPPFTLVFTKKQYGASHGISNSVQHATKRRRREGEVHDTVTNFYDFQHDPQHTPSCDLRCIGVSYDGIADSAGAKKHPDSIGRFATIVSGAVTVLCNKHDLQDCHVGDLLQWEPQDCSLSFHGLPRHWSCPKISKAPSAHIPGSVDMGNELFGASVDLDLLPDDMSVAKINTNLDITDDDADDRNGTVEIAREIATILRHQLEKVGRFTTSGNVPEHLPTMGNLLSFVDRKMMAEVAHHPKHFVDIYATFFFSLIGEENAKDWEEKLYNPASAWWCEETRPSTAGSMDWIDHMLGFGAMIPMTINEANHSVAFNCAKKDISCFCGGRSRGWFLRMIVPMMDFGQTYRWCWRDAQARKVAQAAASPNLVGSLVKGNATLSDVLRKSYTGGSLTQDEMWSLFMGKEDMDDESEKTLRSYTLPFLMAGSTARLMPWVAASVAGIYAMGGTKDSFGKDIDLAGAWGTPNANQNIVKFVGAYGASEIEFQQKRLHCLTHIRSAHKDLSFFFAPLCPDYMIASTANNTNRAVAELSGVALAMDVDAWQLTITDPKTVRYGELACMVMKNTVQRGAAVKDVSIIKGLTIMLKHKDGKMNDFTFTPESNPGGNYVVSVNPGNMCDMGTATNALDSHDPTNPANSFNIFGTEWLKIFLHAYPRTKFSAFAFSTNHMEAAQQFRRIMAVGVITCYTNVLSHHGTGASANLPTAMGALLSHYVDHRFNIIPSTQKYFKWYKRILAKKAGMGLHDGESRVFGMLLEKSIFENGCRVLLMPGLAS